MKPTKPNLDRLLPDLARVLERIRDLLPRHAALERLLLPTEAADLLRVQVETLVAWRCRGQGPPYVKFGRDVRYRASDLLVFVEERVQRSTWEDGKRARRARLADGVGEPADLSAPHA